MRIEEFQNLPALKQQIILTDKGTSVHVVKNDSFGYVLYSVFNFYVEVIYNRATNTIFSMYAFTSDDPKMNFYLDEIRLGDLDDGIS